VIDQGSPVPFRDRLAQVLGPFAPLRRPWLLALGATSSDSSTSRITVRLAKPHRFVTGRLTLAVRRARFAMNSPMPRRGYVPITAVTSRSDLMD